MPRVGASIHTGRLGVAAVERICAQAGQVFRELVVVDIGIDGFVEVVEDGTPTGFLIGVQIKSGPSYFSDDRRTASVPTDADHLAYWARCRFPVVAVAHLEGFGTYWSLITPECTRERILRGPYSIPIACQRSALTADTLVRCVIPDCSSMKHSPLTVQESAELLRVRLDYAADMRDEISVGAPTEWRVLIETALSMSAPDEMVADAACRLSRYFQDEPSEMRGVLRARLETLDTPRIQKLIRAASWMSERNSDQGAELIADLLSYAPDVYARVAAVLEANALPPHVLEAAYQIVEYVTQEVPTPLREKHPSFDPDPRGGRA